ncbi:sensor histidine kinase [uncultured Ruminococcus sp.]|uniref:sensor histidine kinase n=1 Tax=uncultured Ruminococcus sp. TaxID=165186 RepID=UPI00292EFE5E|nr:sensor histidine kinase [uncultured Ruminococcus sp.]
MTGCETMHVFQSRIMTYLSIALMLIVATMTVLMTVGSVSWNDPDDDDSFTMIEGEYSVNGGDWQPTSPNEMVHEDFDRLTIRGRLTNVPTGDNVLGITAENMWFTLKSGGRVIGTNFRADDSAFKNTPGYSISYINAEDVGDGQDIELELTYPYQLLSCKNLSDYFDVFVGSKATVYELLYRYKTPTILFCLLICFFGLFSFPIAGIVLGKINFRYLSFALLCFFAGLFILAQSVASYLPLWIHDPVRCMAAATMTAHLCMISALIYIKVCLKERHHKIVGNIIIVTSVLLTATALVLHYTGVSDLYAGKLFMLIFVAVCAIILTFCMISEVKSSREAFLTLTSMIPVLLCLLLDAFNEFFSFTTVPLFEIGMALTLINQIVILIIDLRKQYLETIRYQQMQKELYEAKVSLMVSQIQPHFLYNSLTSIAMMCTKDPKKARSATINFADYLRGNMNSLKQKAPVPFAQELEHLKKYLMLEEMRFGDMLHIEYDIQTTDFVIPQLSVQPLVENAVKHGVGMKEDGGTVTIATREEDDCYKVIITDDGVGFDTSKPIEDDGRSHVGMENVRQRLKELCDADVIIESELGKGTVATIRIPKQSS